MAQHRRTTRTTRTVARVAALGATSAALLTLAAGTATAGSDDRCERADGVVVCTPADVDVPITVGDLDVNVLGDEDEGFPPVHLGP